MIQKNQIGIVGGMHNISTGEVVFYAIVHVVINTTSMLCSFVCTKSICYVHNSCA